MYAIRSYYVIGATPPLDADSNKMLPTTGPVHENETKAKVKAIKNEPAIPPLSAPESALFTQDDGRTISNAPIKETANTTIV